MKKFTLFLLLFVLLLFAGATIIKNNEEEKKAIMAVLDEESNAWYSSDLDRWQSTFLTNEDFYGLIVSKSGYYLFNGWEKALSASPIREKRQPLKGEKIPLRMKIYSDAAWVVYKNTTFREDGEVAEHQLVTAFLEKDAGKWKIAYRNALNSTSYYSAELSAILLMNYGKSLGKSIEEVAGYTGDLMKSGWNKEAGYKRFQNATLSQWKTLCPAENFKILEQDDDHIVFVADRIIPNLKSAGQFYGVTYDEYLTFMKVVYQRIGDYMNATYNQEVTPEGIKVSISKK